MKHTKTACFLIAFTVLNKFFCQGIYAVLPPVNKTINPNDIKVITTITPTPTTVQVIKVPSIKIVLPLTTIKPTATSTPSIAPTSTPSTLPTATVTGTVLSAETTSTAKIVTVTPTEEPTSSPTITTKKNENQMTTWFLMITVGLLVLIVLIQAWPSEKPRMIDDDQ